MNSDRSKEGPVRSDRFTQPVGGGEVPLVDGAVAVGENLAFQERWWKFEGVVWVLFVIILLADVAGAFGGGPLAQAKIDEPGLGMRVKYQRVMRTGTPSMMAIQFSPDAVQNGTVNLFVSDTVVKGLGEQREPGHQRHLPPGRRQLGRGPSRNRERPNTCRRED